MMQKYEVILRTKSGKTFNYDATAVGVRSAYTDAKRQHGQARNAPGEPIVRVVIDLKGEVNADAK